MTDSTEHVPGPHSITTITGRRLALGRPHIAVDTRTLRLANYLRADQLPALPGKLDNSGLAHWILGHNDQIGDCTEVARCNLILLAAALSQQTVKIDNDTPVADYARSCGYRAGDPSTDNGCVELDVLNDWRANPTAGVGLEAFVSVHPQTADFETLRYAIMLFGAAYIGLNMPHAWQSTVGGLWDSGTDSEHEPGSWGGHAVILTGYDWTLPKPEFTAITWAEPQRLTRDAMRAYCDERYACLTTMWRDHVPQEPPGIDFDKLMADLRAIKG